MIDRHNPLHLSILMGYFNIERRKGFLDDKRLRAALGYLMQDDQSWRSQYNASIETCECPDSVYRSAEGVICKHRVACYLESLVLNEVAAEIAWVLDTAQPVIARMAQAQD